MQSPLEPGLIERCFTGDQDALRALVQRNQGLVYGVALATTGDPALAEDVSQETFVEALRHLSSLREPHKLRPWLAGIARNVGRSAVRKLQRQKIAPADPSEPPTPLDDVLAAEARQLVRECLAQVPQAWRETLVLFYLEERSVRQVAEALGVSEDLVKQRLSRGRRSMREGMAEALGTALDRARPGAALSASILAAITVASRAAQASGVVGKVLLGMSVKKASVVLVAIALAGTGIWYVNRSDASRSDAGQSRPATSSASTRSEAAGEAGSASRGRPSTAASSVAAARSHEAAWRRLRQLVRQARELREQQARVAQSTAVPASTRRGAGHDEPGSLDKDTIKEAIAAIIPLVEECHDQALERAGKKGSSGRLVVEFRIEGEPEVGGVVSQSTISTEKSTLSDPLMRECVQESMFALELPPPKTGGVVNVTYPFQFGADEQPNKTSADD